MENKMSYSELFRALNVIGESFGKRSVKSPFKGRNFVTNNFVGCYKNKQDIFELSYGEGIFGGWCVGVTFNKLKDKSTCFDSPEQLRKYLSDTFGGKND